MPVIVFTFILLFLQLMLDLARLIFEEQKDVPSLIHKIMMHTQSLLRCERCQVLLVDELHQVRVTCSTGAAG